MCKLYVGRRDYEAALRWCSQGVDSCHAHRIDDVVCPRLQSIRGRILALTGHTDAADEDLRAALAAQRALGGEATPSYAYILDNLGIVQLAEHDYENALATTDKVLAIYRNAKGGLLQAQLLSRYWRALALYELERNAEALAEISDIEPRYGALFPLGVMRFDMLALHARALARAQQFDSARATAQQALSIHAPPRTDARVVEEITRLAGRDTTATASAPAN
jgi:tetratricopeptide (TPR) repeat protein